MAGRSFRYGKVNNPNVMEIDFSKVKGIIFDYGGTLDTGGDHWSHVIWAAWQKAGVACDEPSFREAYVYGERELARTLHILPHHNFRDLLEIKMNIELQKLCEMRLFSPDQIETKSREIAGYCYDSARKSVSAAAPVLEKLASRYPVVLVSNFYGNIETVLEDFGIRKYFRSIIESAVVGVRKPDPEIFRLGVKALGIEPGQTLVIGDSYGKDIVPAREAGCQAIWLKGRGWTDKDDSVEYASTIKRLDEVLSFMDQA